jgi:hypothetical protein
MQEISDERFIVGLVPTVFTFGPEVCSASLRRGPIVFRLDPLRAGRQNLPVGHLVEELAQGLKRSG